METFQKPTESELEVLKVLWQMGRATVKQVNEEINKTKETGYTTTLKIMQIMFEKGLVSRNAEGKQHIFEAIVGEEETQKSLLNRFIDSTFQGNAMSLVMQALGNHHASEEELSELKKLIQQLEQDK
ncbi:BlaI/MecI/CopY family transcriptional regulator [Lacihabitans soyangensis]|uniref:BlaI/MecI/CopY family transcriptional regulator n=1 Tax=Lacihabitans soyangensis TaxID=869394 RepID=A0AAE3H6E7_9BACT|nr:BlaI/MecI/CopY family transcriptional regulator [Lacihabitans soyangensis]MCP9766129.1 BlaI/MecI/CopY family transcriptional regulator [Lacihabitans soyangensis]